MLPLAEQKRDDPFYNPESSRTRRIPRHGVCNRGTPRGSPDESIQDHTDSLHNGYLTTLSEDWLHG